jgi:hypothetical protein
MRLLVLTLALLAGPALADGTYNGKTVDCYCTDKSGSRVEMGETICMQVDGKSFVAQCQMSLNNPMWRKLQDGCPTSALTPRPSLLPKLRQPRFQSRGVHTHI